MVRCLPQVFTTSQHMIIKLLANARLIFDATKRFPAYSTPINTMTFTPFGTEIDCLYGTDPDIMTAFSIVVAHVLYLQPALSFKADFSPQNWEYVR